MPRRIDVPLVQVPIPQRQLIRSVMIMHVISHGSGLMCTSVSNLKILLHV